MVMISTRRFKYTKTSKFWESNKVKTAAAIFIALCSAKILLTSSTIEKSVESSVATHTATGKKRLEFVHITKTGGSAIEKAASEKGIFWGACHYLNVTVADYCLPTQHFDYITPLYQSYVRQSPWHTPPKLLKTQDTIIDNPYTGADLFAVVRNPYDRVISEYYCPWQGFQPKYRKNTKHTKDPNDPKIMNWWVKDTITRLEKSLNEFMKIKPEDRPKEQSLGVNEDPYILAQKHNILQAEYVFDGNEQVIKNIVHYEDLTKEFDKLMKEYGLDVRLPPKAHSGVYTSDDKKLSYLDLDEESIAVINRYAAKDFELLGYEMVTKFDKDGNYSLKAKKTK